MYCGICEKRHGIKKAMVPGKALLPVWGNSRNNHAKGSTIYHVGGVVGTVLKCGECGHSVSFNGVVMGYLPERTTGRIYTE